MRCCPESTTCDFCQQKRKKQKKKPVTIASCVGWWMISAHVLINNKKKHEGQYDNKGEKMVTPVGYVLQQSRFS